MLGSASCALPIDMRVDKRPLELACHFELKVVVGDTGCGRVVVEHDGNALDNDLLEQDEDCRYEDACACTRDCVLQRERRLDERGGCFGSPFLVHLEQLQPLLLVDAQRKEQNGHQRQDERRSHQGKIGPQAHYAGD